MASQILNNSLTDGVIVASAVEDDPIVAALIDGSKVFIDGRAAT